MGKRDRRRRRPAAGSRALGGQVLHARDDGHRPQPRASTTSRSRAWPSRPATSGSPTTPTAASSPCTAASCSSCPARSSTRSSTRPRSWPGPTSDAEVPRRAAALPGRRLPADRRAPHRASRSPRTPASSCAAPSRRCSAAGTGRGPSPTASASASPHDLGTAVNVQAMVFGNRDDNSGTGVGFTRDPATGAKGAYGDFLVNAQGEDVVAGIRNTEPLSALEDAVPQGPRRAARASSPASSATTATCATPSSPSSRASCGCSRPGSASAPARPRCGWRSTWCARATSGSPGPRRSSRITEDHLDSVLHPQFAGSGYEVLAKGLGASRRAPRWAASTSPPTTPRRRPSGASR